MGKEKELTKIQIAKVILAIILLVFSGILAIVGAEGWGWFLIGGFILSYNFFEEYS